MSADWEWSSGCSASRQAQAHFFLIIIITLLTAPSVLGVLCICCLRVLLWNKPQRDIPSQREESQRFPFSYLIPNIMNIQTNFSKLSSAWTITWIFTLVKSPCPPFDSLFRWQRADCALWVCYCDCGPKVALVLGTLVPWVSFSGSIPVLSPVEAILNWGVSVSVVGLSTVVP